MENSFYIIGKIVSICFKKFFVHTNFFDNIFLQSLVPNEKLINFSNNVNSNFFDGTKKMGG